MSDGNRIIRIHVLDGGTWVVDFRENPEHIWRAVLEYFARREGYTIRQDLRRIYARTLGQLIDIIQETSEEK